MSNTVETAEKKVYGTFLRNDVVSIKAIEGGAKWSNLLAAGQDKRKDPFIYGKVKRSFQVPLRSFNNGGGVTPILDDLQKVLIKKYETEFPDGMTEREFFEKELGIDLNHTKVEGNFWREDRRSRIVLTRDGLKLHLNEPLDMLRYKILLSNTSLIAPSYEDRFLKASYEFMVVDEDKLISKKSEEAKYKSKAYQEYAKLISSKESMISYIKSLGRTVGAAVTEDWLVGEIYAEVEKDPINFLNTVTDKHYKAKIFIQDAIEAGCILKKGDRRYTLDNGVELGDLNDTIYYLSSPENQDVKLRIKGRIELAKR